ncbi:MASE1 domain-containing protein [Actinopolymorpha sp. NPDC004070]|uniref:MASE1 domain-containing protein n=1 Tax=Actinopolymorpha sp. NPDC004070 TaxID=3154548 RepID=UPI0033A3FD82
MERQLALRRFFIVGSQNLVVAGVLLGTSRPGLVVFVEPGKISPFWPPTGVAVAALLLWGWRMWPGILLGSVAIDIFTTPAPVIVPTAAASTAACMYAYWALRRVGFRIQLDRLKDALALVFLAALGAMLISSTIGTIMRLVGGVVTAGTFLTAWFTWWTGDAMGVLFVTPLLLLLYKVPWRQYRYVYAVRLAEISALLAGSFGLILMGELLWGVLFLAFPLIVLAAWRYQLAGAAPLAVIASAVTIDASVAAYGTFAGKDLLGRMLLLQLFNGSIVLTGLVLSAAISERNRTREELEHACGQLQQTVGKLDEMMRPGTQSDHRQWTDHQRGQ